MPTVAVEGHRFYYEEQGSGAPLLLIHETGGHTAMLEPLAARLGSSFRTITYDRRGFGRSEAPLPTSTAYLRRQADDAAVLLRELGAPRAIVTGWGMGGIIALALAIHHPGIVSRAILYNPSLHAKKHLGLRLASALAGATALGKVRMHRRGAKRFFRFAFGYGAFHKIGNAFDELDPRVRDGMLAHAPTVLAELEAGTGEELSAADLSRIGVPVGIALGARSARYLLAATERCAAIFPSSKIHRVADGDHTMSLRQPDRLAGAIRELAKEPGLLR